MNPKPMTNDSSRVAPDRRIPLSSPTPLRSRRRIATGTLSVLLGLSCFVASPAWAYKAGQGADDRLSGIPEYADVAAYLADTNRNNHRYVKIGEYTLPRGQVEAFHQARILTDATKPLTDAKLIASFADVAAYLADSDRTTRLYAYLENKDKVYRVTDLEEHDTDADPLSDDNLPNNPVGSLVSGNDVDIFGNTAVGRNASATGYNATALGAGASARGDRSIAIGHGATTTSSTRFQGSLGAIAIGMESHANGWKSIAIGAHARTNSNAAIAVGRSSSATAAGGVAVGVGARAAGQSSIALGQGASATGTKGIAIGSGVSAGYNEVVVGTNDHTYDLPGLAKHASGTRVVTVDSEGRLSTQAATSSPSLSASLRGAAALSSEVTALNPDTGTRTDAADYEEAPAIGSGPTAPETADQRRVVVQDTNRDGSVRLRTLDFSDLSGMDRRLTGVEQRVSSLSDRLNKATAMSAALSALPNVVPGDNRFFLGVGAGHYSSEQALAVGMSARVGRHVFVNAGAALASGDDASVRGGVGVVW